MSKLIYFITSVIFFGCFVSWLTAVVIIAMIFLHENARTLKAYKIGLKTKEVMYIPFLGGLALFNGYQFYRRDALVISQVGIFTSVLCNLVFFSFFQLTGDEYCAGISYALTMVNILFMLPIGSFYGCNFFKSVSFSIHPFLGFLVLVLGVVLSSYLVTWNILCIFLLMWAFSDLCYDSCFPHDQINLTFLEGFRAALVYICIGACLYFMHDHTSLYSDTEALKPFVLEALFSSN